MTIVVWWLVAVLPGSNVMQISQNDWPDKATCEAQAEQLNRERGMQPKRFCIPHVRVAPPTQQPTINNINPQRKLT